MLEKIKTDLKNAMKGGEKSKLNPLRNLISKMKMKEIEKGEALTNEECLKVCIASAKQIKDSISQFEEGGRFDLSENEKKELVIIEKYLPKQLSDEEIISKIKIIIDKVNAHSPSDMGKVMGAIMSEVSGKADGKYIQKLVLKELSK